MGYFCGKLLPSNNIMSSSRKLNENERKYPKNALNYCPDYVQFDINARIESKTRFKKHVMSRKNLLIQCIDSPINDIRNPILSLQFNQVPRYIDDDTIINGALKAIDYE